MGVGGKGAGVGWGGQWQTLKQGSKMIQKAGV